MGHVGHQVVLEERADLARDLNSKDAVRHLLEERVDMVVDQAVVGLLVEVMVEEDLLEEIGLGEADLGPEPDFEVVVVGEEIEVDVVDLEDKN